MESTAVLDWTMKDVFGDLADRRVHQGVDEASGNHMTRALHRHPAALEPRNWNGFGFALAPTTSSTSTPPVFTCGLNT